MARESIGVCVEHIEVVGVPQRQQELAHGLLDRPQREAVAGPRLARGEEVPAHRVRAEALDHLPGIDDVAQRLGHFASLLVDEQSMADDIAVRRAVQQQGGDR
jgi:hypothetical protein